VTCLRCVSMFYDNFGASLLLSEPVNRKCPPLVKLHTYVNL